MHNTLHIGNVIRHALIHALSGFVTLWLMRIVLLQLYARRLAERRGRHVPLCLPCPSQNYFFLSSAHTYSIVDDISRYFHNLDAVRRVLSWPRLLPPTNHVIRAAQFSLK